MDSNFAMLKKLIPQYSPAFEGVATEAEIMQIKEALCLDQMDGLQLQNLRDFTVLYIGKLAETEGIEHMKARMLRDKMSAITSVIDHCKFNKGFPV